jgi:hypothetical protein
LLVTEADQPTALMAQPDRPWMYSISFAEANRRHRFVMRNWRRTTADSRATQPSGARTVDYSTKDAALS